MRAPSGATVHIFPTIGGLAEAAAREIAERINCAAEAEAYFNLAISGGESPKPLYRLLAAEPLRSTVAWPVVKIFFSDERAVPPDHPDSNYRMACEAWLAGSPIPPDQIFRMEGETPDLHAAAEKYSEIMTHQIPSGPTGFPALDLALLGMGGDGHTASLFPKTAALDETLRVVTANEVPQKDTRRLTLTFPELDAAREIWFFVTGAQKARRVAQCLGYIPTTEPLPAALIHPTSGNLHWWLDAEAAAEIK